VNPKRNINAMTYIVEIVKDGQIQNTVTLEDGKYIFGRDSSCDIVLSDVSVSKKHGLITIRSNEITVEDAGSVNGIYYQDKRITTKTVSPPFFVNIGPFILKLKSASQKTQSEDGIALIGFFRRIFVKNITAAMFIFTVFLMLSTFLIVYQPLKKRLQEVQSQEFLRNGIIYTRYLSEMNRPFLENREYSRLRLNPVNKENGVTYALILDNHGRVLAPHEMQGDFFNWNELATAYEKNRLTIGEGLRSEKIIFNPISVKNNIIGAAVIGYSQANLSINPVSFMNTGAFLLLMLVMFIGSALSFVMIRTLLKPLKELYEEAELAIKQGKATSELKYAYPEVEKLKQVIDRLLIRKINAGKNAMDGAVQAFPPTDVSGPEESAPVNNLNPKKSPVEGVENEIIEEIESPWCMIDCENFMLVKVSQDLKSIPELAECREGMHLVEAFKAEIIQAVSQLLENKANECLPINLDQNEYRLKRIEKQDGKTNIIFVFEDVK
jgi:hypothetical protein